MLEHPTGSASLKLPCLVLKGLHLGDPKGGTKTPPVLPGIGAYKGYIGSVILQPATGTTLSVTFHKGANGGTAIDGSISKTFATNPSAAPLYYQSQIFHATAGASAAQVSNDLSSARLSLGSGPQPLKGTDLQWTATGAPLPTSTGTGTCTTTPGAKAIGATRTSNVRGTLGLQTCVTSGTYQVDATRSFGELYSSALSVKAPTPLKVVSVNPADKATGVATTTPAITIKFSNAMQATNATATVYAGTDFHFLKDPTLDASKKTMTFKLDKALQPNQTYTVQVSAEDEFNQYGNSKTTFTTGQ
jgi:methionine-rich copper-binding protein CopC